ncbi:hypothetical protein L204_103546 [Cryptococcus depauperatus]
MSYQPVPLQETVPPLPPPKQHPTQQPLSAPASGRFVPTHKYGPSASGQHESYLPGPGGQSRRHSDHSAVSGSSGMHSKQGVADPMGWGAMTGGPEDDDYMHNPDPKNDKKVPLISNFPTVIDKDTPQDAMSRKGFDGEDYNLVFSDEFEKDGRTFFPGDDPYWTAVDLHYWPTGDGKLVITMTQEPIHDLNYKSGMLQSWNQMCFQYSVYIEVAVSLPGTNTVGGFWPGVWMMGNLGRPGYGASTEGTWPYTYDSCDIGTLRNQTTADGTGPITALTSGRNDGPISFLPGQRLSACTCKGEDHPGPDVSYGRGVPEIDILEGQIDHSVQRGQVSQSCQVAPFDERYQYLNTTKGGVHYDPDITIWNSYLGGEYQEAVSSLTYIDNANYVGTGGQFGVYGFEYYADPNARDKGHITWVANGKKSWTMYPAAIGPSDSMKIGQRLITEEPMAMTVDFAHLQTPAEMLVDYVRVYQRPEGKLGCDPKDRPTADYIERHLNAYSNANLTTWDAAGYTFPKNSLIDQC